MKRLLPFLSLVFVLLVSCTQTYIVTFQGAVSGSVSNLVSECEEGCLEKYKSVLLGIILNFSFKKSTLEIFEELSKQFSQFQYDQSNSLNPLKEVF